MSTYFGAEYALLKVSSCQPQVKSDTNKLRGLDDMRNEIIATNGKFDLVKSLLTYWHYFSRFHLFLGVALSTLTLSLDEHALLWLVLSTHARTRPVTQKMFSVAAVDEAADHELYPKNTIQVPNNNLLRDAVSRTGRYRLDSRGSFSRLLTMSSEASDEDGSPSLPPIRHFCARLDAALPPRVVLRPI
jgi:hypothetical protein